MKWRMWCNFVACYILYHIHFRLRLYMDFNLLDITLHFHATRYWTLIAEEVCDLFTLMCIEDILYVGIFLWPSKFQVLHKTLINCKIWSTMWNVMVSFRSSIFNSMKHVLTNLLFTLAVLSKNIFFIKHLLNIMQKRINLSYFCYLSLSQMGLDSAVDLN